MNDRELMREIIEGTSLPAVIGVLIAAYPNQPFPEDSARVYTRLLADIEDDRLRPAVEQLLMVCTFRPTVAEIRLTVARNTLDLPSAAVIYGRIMDYMGEGRIDLPDFAREIMQSMGGPWGFQHSENPGAQRTLFLREYDAAAERLIASTATLPGIPNPATVVAALPVTTSMEPRPLVAWADERGEPTDEQKRDAMQVLREGLEGDPLAMAALEMLDTEGQ